MFDNDGDMVYLGALQSASTISKPETMPELVFLVSCTRI